VFQVLIISGLNTHLIPDCTYLESVLFLLMTYPECVCVCVCVCEIVKRCGQ